MESKVVFRDRQELQSADLNNVQEFTQESIDHIVLDTIDDGRAYSGFECSKTGAAEITADPGRLYALGEVYVREESVVLDCFNVLPLVTKKRVAIVAWGQSVETDVQPRDFLVDAVTGSTEPQSVAMETNRHAELNLVAGLEATDPAYPTTDANVTVIAYALLDTSGVVSIEQWTDTQVLNLREVGDRTGELEDWRSNISARVDTLGSDLAALAARLGSFALDTSLQALALVVAQLTKRIEKLETPAYLYHHVEQFMDTTDAATGASGYEAFLAQGLRFPLAIEDSVTLALQNPNDPLIIYYGGHVLPYHIHRLRFDCKGYHWQHRCGMHSWYAFPHILLMLSRHRWRCGPEWISTVEEWEMRQLENALKIALHQSIGTWNDQTYQQYINAVKVAFPMAWWRGRYTTSFWRDFVEDFYWAAIQSTATLTAYHVAQTVLVAQDGYLTKVGLYFTQLAVAGDVDVLVCKLNPLGHPDLDNVISRTTVARADLQVGTGSGGAGLPSIVETVVPITPTLLQGGQRYAVVLAVQGDHWIAGSDSDIEILQGQFFVWQSSAWAVQTGTIKMRFYFAQWLSGRHVIDMTPLQLAGGIRTIDILGEIAIPGVSNVIFEVQVGGTWYPIDQNLDLSSLPALLPLRVVFVGTTDIMPLVRVTYVTIKVRRAKTTFKYISNTRALGGNASKITVAVRMTNFVEANHDLTVTVKTNAGATTETADTVADTTLPDGRIQRLATFNIAADNDYFYVLDGAVASINSQFVVNDVEDIATT